MGLRHSGRKVRDFSLLGGFDYYTPGWKGLLALIGLLILGALIGSAVMIVLGYCMPRQSVDTYGLLITYPLQFLPAMMYASYQSRRNAAFEERNPLNDRHFGKVGFWPVALLAVVATVAAAYMCDAVSYFLPKMPETLEKLLKGMTGGPVWVSLLSVSVMAPFFEEWLCRGEVLRGLLGKVRPVWAIVLSALFFAVIHLNPWQAVPAFLLGCLFGYVYYKTGSLLVTMLMHCANNTFSVICSHIDAFSEADTWLDVLSPDWYATGFVLAAALVCVLVLLLRKIPLRSRS